MAQDPKAKEPAAAGEAPAPKSKKKLIIIIAAVVVLLAGAGGGWYFMKSKEAVKKPAKHGEVHEEAEAEAEEAEGEHGPAAPIFLPLETFTVNLLPDPDEKFLQLDVSIQVKKPEEAEALKAQMPAIRNRLLMLLTSKQANQISTMEGKQELSDEILAEVNKPFTKHGKPQKVTGVFFTSFVVQ
jgi:flagellar FliL protein